MVVVLSFVLWPSGNLRVTTSSKHRVQHHARYFDRSKGCTLSLKEEHNQPWPQNSTKYVALHYSRARRCNKLAKWEIGSSTAHRLLTATYWCCGPVRRLETHGHLEEKYNVVLDGQVFNGCANIRVRSVFATSKLVLCDGGLGAEYHAPVSHREINAAYYYLFRVDGPGLVVPVGVAIER